MTSAHPLVSILIPCYNAGRWIAETLESALTQTYPRCEIIVVNDGSTDDSADVIERFRPRGIRIINQKNAGQSAAFNRAIASANGHYFEFLDADDILAPDKVEIQVRRLAQEPEDVMASGRWGRFRDDVRTTTFQPDALWEDLDPMEWIVRAWTSHSMMHGAAYLIPAALVRSAGGWREDLSLINDFEFFSRVMLHSRRIVFCPQATTHYRSAIAGSLSGAKSVAAWESAFRSIETGTRQLLEHEDSTRTRRACAAAWRSFVHDSYPAVPQLEREAIDHIRALGERVGAPVWGPKFQVVSRLIGWRLAKRLQQMLRSNQPTTPQ